jgi:hypothetical protein
VKLKQNLHTWWIGLQLMKRRWQRQKSKMPWPRNDMASKEGPKQCGEEKRIWKVRHRNKW